MLVHCVTLPSFPNLNSCSPLAGVRPLTHIASLTTVISCGPKPPGLAVHFVTLPSFPNLNSWRWLVVESKPDNHNASLKTVKSCGNKSVPMLVHFVTLPSFPTLTAWSRWREVPPPTTTDLLKKVSPWGPNPVPSRPWPAAHSRTLSSTQFAGALGRGRALEPAC